QLGERDLDGDADRAQGRDRGRQGHGDDDARLPDAARVGRAGVGLLPQRADEGREVSGPDSAAGPAGDRAESRRDGQVPAADAAALLQSGEVSNVSRTTRYYVPDGAGGGWKLCWRGDSLIERNLCRLLSTLPPPSRAATRSVVSLAMAAWHSCSSPGTANTIAT